MLKNMHFAIKLLIMKKSALLLFAILLMAYSQASAQKILMKIGTVTAAGGEDVRALEFQINASSNYLQGAGASVGKPVPSSLSVKRTHNVATNSLFNNIVKGTSIPEVKFEYYDAANVLYYTITLTNVFLTQLYWLSPECPTCLKLEQQLGFVFKTIKMADAVTGASTTWDIGSGSVTTP